MVKFNSPTIHIKNFVLIDKSCIIKTIKTRFWSIVHLKQTFIYYLSEIQAAF